MKQEEIQVHNKVNMQRLNRAEQIEFLAAIGAKTTDTPYIYECSKEYDKRKYFICAYCMDGRILINSFNNRTRLVNLIKSWQREYKNIQARIIVHHKMEDKDVGNREEVQ